MDHSETTVNEDTTGGVPHAQIVDGDSSETALTERGNPSIEEESGQYNDRAETGLQDPQEQRADLAEIVSGQEDAPDEVGAAEKTDQVTDCANNSIPLPANEAPTVLNDPSPASPGALPPTSPDVPLHASPDVPLCTSPATVDHREDLLSVVRRTAVEQEKLKLTNLQLQHRIAEYLARKKTEEPLDLGRSAADLEKRYNQCLASLDVMSAEIQAMESCFRTHEQEMTSSKDAKLACVQQALQEYVQYTKEQAQEALYSRTGKRLTSQEMDRYHALGNAKEQAVIQARVENLRLLNKIQKLEELLKAKDQLAEGLHMIDFEQLKINNVDLNEKVEERNEDTIKLKQKVATTVQVLTHVKEKQQFLENENEEKCAKLSAIEAQVAHKRDLLTRSKQARDALRADNMQLKQRGGLVGHKLLLADYEEKKDEEEELRERIEHLKSRYSELVTTCGQLKERMAQTS